MAPRSKSTKPIATIVQQPVAQSSGLPTDYVEFLTNLKSEIRSTQMRAGFAVNRELVVLYWRLGAQILRKESEVGSGAKVVEQLAVDLKAEFPAMTGLSARNLRYMKKLAELFPDEPILHEVLAKLSWYTSKLSSTRPRPAMNNTGTPVRQLKTGGAEMSSSIK